MYRSVQACTGQSNWEKIMWKFQYFLPLTVQAWLVPAGIITNYGFQGAGRIQERVLNETSKQGVKVNILREIDAGTINACTVYVFYVKSISVILKPQKLPFSPFCILRKCEIFSKIQILSLQCWNGISWPHEIIPNWFDVKSGKLLNFHIVEYPQSKTPIRLPTRHVRLQN